MKQTATASTPRLRRTAATSRAPASSTRLEHLAVVVDALVHLEAVAPPDVRRRRRPCRRPRGLPSCRGGSRSRRGSRVVVTIAARGKVRVISAFVATVDAVREDGRRRAGRPRPPCARRRSPRRSGRPASTAPSPPTSTPVSSSSTQMSVNVPPTSTATRRRRHSSSITSSRAGSVPWLKPRCMSSVGSTKPSPALATILPPDSNSYSISPEMT